MHQLLALPFDTQMILQKKKRIRRELKECGPFIPTRIALLGGATTSVIKDVLELFLLDSGIKPVFYESEYDKWYEDAVFPNDALDAFQPQVVLLHTSTKNITGFPTLLDAPEAVEMQASAEIQRFVQVWQALQEKYNPIILQDNFCLPDERVIGNLAFSHTGGAVHFVNCLNSHLLRAAEEIKTLYLHDVFSLSAKLGLRNWTDETSYHLYKMALSFDAVSHYCYSLTQMIKAAYGKTRKCLVLDLDNTLWGGVIGDDGLDGIQLGHETAAGEAFMAFQRYVLKLKDRGVILAVCSKNDEPTAREGFSHPDSMLKPDDFAAFIANWEPKHLNLLQIAREINIGTDSLVFLDDNPAEREIIRENLPEVIVPEVEAGEPESYIRALEDGMYFETVTISQDDLKRNESYQVNRQRNLLEKQFSSYEEFLQSLEMKAEIAPFDPIYLDRIAQLTNKTNQFNLTTRRYTRAELEDILRDDSYLTLYCRLTDKFGDNGIVSLLIGKKVRTQLQIELWLMSCRVLKRRVEDAMFRVLVQQADAQGIQALRGYYYRTPKNGMVADLYRKLGFAPADNEGVEWCCEVAESLLPNDLPIEIAYNM